MFFALSLHFFVYIRVGHLLGIGKVMGSMLGQNIVIAKDVRKLYLLLLCQMRDINNMSGGLPWSQTCATQYHAQLELPDKGCAIKGLVVCLQ